jgi:hypothetical protein
MEKKISFLFDKNDEKHFEFTLHLAKKLFEKKMPEVCLKKLATKSELLSYLGWESSMLEVYLEESVDCENYENSLRFQINKIKSKKNQIHNFPEHNLFEYGSWRDENQFFYYDFGPISTILSRFTSIKENYLKFVKKYKKKNFGHLERII